MLNVSPSVKWRQCKNPQGNHAHCRLQWLQIPNRAAKIAGQAWPVLWKSKTSNGRAAVRAALQGVAPPVQSTKATVS